MGYVIYLGQIEGKTRLVAACKKAENTDVVKQEILSYVSGKNGNRNTEYDNWFYAENEGEALRVLKDHDFEDMICARPEDFLGELEKEPITYKMFWYF